MYAIEKEIIKPRIMKLCYLSFLLNVFLGGLFFYRNSMHKCHAGAVSIILVL
jgi:hypothetical protein